MDNKKKIILIIFVIILIGISILAIYLSTKQDKDEDSGIQSEPTTQVTINNDLLVLKDDTCFDIQSTINEYYLKLEEGNYDYVYNVLTDDYKEINEITKDNISEKLNSSINNTFIIDRVIHNNDTKITYYFVEGLLITSAHHDEESSGVKNVQYLLIVKNNKYVIRPFDSEVNIETYARSFKIEDSEIKSNYGIKKSNMTERNKLLYYMANFINLNMYDKNESYKLLGNKTKEKYSLESFLESDITINPNIFAYTSKRDYDSIIYTIKDHKQNTIEIIEEYPSKYKINF